MVYLILSGGNVDLYKQIDELEKKIGKEEYNKILKKIHKEHGREMRATTYYLYLLDYLANR